MTFGSTDMDIHQEDILGLIPQRPPFVLVDRLVFSDETTSRSAFEVKDGNIFVVENKLTEPALIENIAQTAAARAGFLSLQSGLPVMIGYIGAIKKLEIYDLPTSGNILETEVIVENQIFDVTIISGKITCNDILVARCEMKIFIQPNTK